MTQDHPSPFVERAAEREEFLRPAEVCRWLQVSRTWLYAAAKNGRIPSHRLGGDGPLRFRLSELEAWIEDGSTRSRLDAADHSP